MTQNDRQENAMDDPEKREAGFLLAEFNALVDRARDSDQIAAARINFFLIVVGATAAGVAAATELRPSLTGYLWLVFIAGLFVLVLGIVTLRYSVRSAAESVEMFRYAGRVRCWFSDLAPEATPYFAFIPGDNLPRFSTRSGRLRGGEATVITINSMLVVGLSAILLYELAGVQLSQRASLAILIGVIPAVLAWYLQRWLVEVTMKRLEARYRAKDVHFPSEAYKSRFEEPVTDRPKES
jgi:hypothetical protein